MATINGDSISGLVSTTRGGWISHITSTSVKISVVSALTAIDWESTSDTLYMRVVYVEAGGNLRGEFATTTDAVNTTDADTRLDVDITGLDPDTAYDALIELKTYDDPETWPELRNDDDDTPLRFTTWPA